MADYLPHTLSDESCAGLLCRLWTHNAQAGPGEDSLLGGCAYSAAIYWIAPLPLFGQELQKEEDLQQKVRQYFSAMSIYKDPMATNSI